MDELLIFLALVFFVGVRLWAGYACTRFLDGQSDKLKSLWQRARDRGY